MARLVNKRILGDRSTQGPALASHDGRLYLAWKGAGNDNLNVMFSANNGNTFHGKATSPDASDHAPALASARSGLYIAWKGSGNEHLNVARVQLIASTSGAFGIEPKFADKGTLTETSTVGPGLVVNAGERMLAWRGVGGDNLNLRLVGAHGTPHAGLAKATFRDTSDRSPAVASHRNEVYIAWKGSGNQNLNVARAAIGGGAISSGLVGKVILGDTSTQGPSLVSHAGRLALAWKGAGNDNLNVMFSSNNGVSFGGKTTFHDASDQMPALAVHNGRLFIAWKGSGNEHLNVAEIVD